MEVHPNEAQKKESVTNTLTGVNDDKEHFFFSYQMREKFGLYYIKNIYMFLSSVKKL